MLIRQVTILNALAGDVAPVDPAYFPYAYWTQANFFNNCTDTIVTLDYILAHGVYMEQLGLLFSTCYPFMTVQVIHANMSSALQFRKDIIQELTR